MIRRYIASLSTSILKRTCAATALLALTLGCSSTKPPNTAAASGSIDSAAQSPQSILARNPNKPRKSGSLASCPQNDAFTESVNFATQASNLAQSANSKQDWDEVATLWVQAVAWMQAIPPGSPSLKVFNFSVNGATAQVVDFQLRRLLKPEHLPQMIIWADGVRGFNSGRDDRTFNSIVDSEGSQLLAAGIRPQLPSDEPNVIPACYKFPQPCPNNTFRRGLTSVERPLWGGQDARPTIKFLSSGTGILPVAENAARYELKPIAADAATPQAQLIPVSRPTTVAIRQVSQLADSIDSNGFMPISDRYNPNTYYRERAYVSGQYDRDYKDFNLGGKQATAFNSVVAFTKARKIPLIFVNLPLTDDYLDGTRLSAEQQFRQRMQQLSQQKGFAFRDLSQRWPGRNDYFFDPSHLNHFGAMAVSRLLATDSSIVWPRPKSTRTDG